MKIRDVLKLIEAKVGNTRPKWVAIGTLYT
jgi:hypothetical protein